MQHTPPSSLEQRGSPKKRARFDASVLEQPQDEPMPLATAEQPAVALKDLPLPLLLLTLAQACHSSALSLHPVLSRRPSTAAGSNAQQRYAQAWLSYTRLIAAAIALLKKVVELAQGGAGGEGAAGGRMELRARAMLAEMLALCDSSARAEREKMISRGVSPLSPKRSRRAVRAELTSLFCYISSARRCGEGEYQWQSLSPRLSLIRSPHNPPLPCSLALLKHPTAPLTRSVQALPHPAADPGHAVGCPVLAFAHLRLVYLDSAQIRSHHPAPTPRIACLLAFLPTFAYTLRLGTSSTSWCQGPPSS